MRVRPGAVTCTFRLLQVLCAGFAAEVVQSSGLPLLPVGTKQPASVRSPLLALDADAIAAKPAPAASAPAASEQTGQCQAQGRLFCEPLADGGAGSVGEAVAELAEAAGCLCASGDAAFADPAEEARFQLEAGGEPGGWPAHWRTACVTLFHCLFLAGLPGYDGAPGWAGRARAVVAAASLGAAALPWEGPTARWAAMHAAFFAGCAALALARPAPFVLLGFATGASLCFLAPPCASATAAGRGLGAACALVLGALTIASRRDGLPPPSPVASLPLLLLVSCLRGWIRRVGRAARVRWLLDGRLRRSRAALWAALRERLPEHLVEGVVRGAPTAPHVKRAATVLQALLTPDNTPPDGPASPGGSGGGGVGREVVAGLHELLTLFDREV